MTAHITRPVLCMADPDFALGNRHKLVHDGLDARLSSTGEVKSFSRGVHMLIGEHRRLSCIFNVDEVTSLKPIALNLNDFVLQYPFDHERNQTRIRSLILTRPIVIKW